jgi:hypothetical protein
MQCHLNAGRVSESFAGTGNRRPERKFQVTCVTMSTEPVCVEMCVPCMCIYTRDSISSV